MEIIFVPHKGKVSTKVIPKMHLMVLWPFCFHSTYCVGHLDGVDVCLNIIVIGLHADDVINDLIHLEEKKTGQEFYLKYEVMESLMNHNV